MATAKSVPVRGTKFYVATGFDSDESITVVTATNPGTITSAALSASKGDIVKITGIDGFNGEYVVSGVLANVYTLVGADWSGNQVPSSYTGAKVAKILWGNNFCDIKSFSRTGGTFDQEEVTNLCSEGKEFENGLFDGGTLDLTFNYFPDDGVQQTLSGYEDTGERFWTKWSMPKVSTILLHNVSIQTGANIEGAVSGGTTRYQSGVSLKISGRPVRVASA